MQYLSPVYNTFMRVSHHCLTACSSLSYNFLRFFTDRDCHTHISSSTSNWDWQILPLLIVWDSIPMYKTVLRFCLNYYISCNLSTLTKKIQTNYIWSNNFTNSIKLNCSNSYLAIRCWPSYWLGGFKLHTYTKLKNVQKI